MSFDLIENFFGEHLVARNSNGGNNGVLPGIETIDLSHRNVETLAEAIFQAFHNMPLLFERMRGFHYDIKRQYTDNGHWFR